VEFNLHSVSDFQRCRDFLARRNLDRPLLSGMIRTPTLTANYRRGIVTIPDGPIGADSINPGSFERDYEELYLKQLECEADIPWAAYPLNFVPWGEAILGCAVRKNGVSLVAEPWVSDYRQIAELRVDPKNSWLTKLLEFQGFLIRMARGRFPVSKALLRGPVDLLSALRGPANMRRDLDVRPDEVDAALNHLTDLWIQITHLQLNAIPPFGGGFSFGQFDLWSPEPGTWFQNDSLVLWPPNAYREHVRPCEERLARSAKLTGRHLHHNSFFVVGDLIQMPGLAVIQVSYEVPRAMPLGDMLPFLRQAIEAKPLLMWCDDVGLADLQFLAEHLPTGGLSLAITGDTPQKIRSTVAAIDRIWSER
jgi:hypothetical protein